MIFFKKAEHVIHETVMQSVFSQRLLQIYSLGNAATGSDVTSRVQAQHPLVLLLKTKAVAGVRT